MRRPDLRDDSGVSLIELIVSLTIMAVAMTMFTAASLQMYRAANKTESLSNAQSELNTVFLRLDRLVRYAAGISQVKQSGGTYYIGVLVVEAERPLCTAIRLVGAEKKLQIVTWNESDPTNRPPWTTLANNVLGRAVKMPDGTVEFFEPFTFVKATPTYNFDRLQLELTAVIGSGVQGTLTNTKVQFTALNTSLTSSTPDVCTTYQGRP